MRSEPPVIAKITIPAIGRSLERPRLLHRLDELAPSGALWISGPAGAGKTTLMAGWLGKRPTQCLWYQMDAGDGDPATFFYYLGKAAGRMAGEETAPPLPLFTPDYLAGLDAFSLRFFEELFRRVRPPAFLVFDNFQEVDPDAPIGPILSRAIGAAPPGVSVAAISRCRPPPVMSRLLANRRLHMMDSDELAFTPEECEAVLPLFRKEKFSSDQVLDIHRRTRGWIAGLVLWVMKTGPAEGPASPLAERTPSLIFDYFASEILSRIDAKTRDFLLRSALLSEMTAESAAEMTGNPEAGRILGYIRHRNFFLECREGPELRYQYHPLFRDFLRRQAERAFPPETLRALQIRAGDILAESGLTEAAARRYREAGDPGRLVGLILSRAGPLCFSGRHRTLLEWMDALPEPLIREDPWLIFWRAAARTPRDPLASRKDFGEACRKFLQTGDLLGQVRSFQMGVETFFMFLDDFRGLDEWIAIGNRIGSLPEVTADDHLSACIASAMLCAIMQRAPDHPALPTWIERSEALLNRTDDIRLQVTTAAFLVHIFCQQGEMLRADTVIRRIWPVATHPHTPPVARILFSTAHCMFLGMNGEEEHCRKTAEEALAIGGRAGVHLFDGLLYAYAAIGSLSTEDFPSAQRFLDRLADGLKPGAFIDILHYHLTRALNAYVQGRLNLAAAEIKAASKIIGYNGAPIASVLIHGLLHVKILMEAGKMDQAWECLRSVLGAPRKSGCVAFEFNELMTHADLLLEFGREQEARDRLERAFRLSKEKGIIDGVWWLKPRLSRLCRKALEEGIETDQVCRFIARYRLVPAEPLNAGPEWPWPVKIHVFGRFRVELRESEFPHSSKPAKKPLELLMILICRGPNGVSREEATDALWPDTDGDRARQNIDTTLHRLRRLLGAEAALHATDGRLALSPGCCWVDAWHFDSLMDRADRETDAVRKKPLLEKALALYRGPVAGDIADVSICLSFAERLNAQWVHGTLALASILEASGQIGPAIAVCVNALGMNDPSEPISLALMRLMTACGRTAEALEIYRRCRDALSRKQGTAPGPDIQNFYRRIRQQR